MEDATSGTVEALVQSQPAGLVDIAPEQPHRDQLREMVRHDARRAQTYCRAELAHRGHRLARDERGADLVENASGSRFERFVLRGGDGTGDDGGHQ